VLEPNSNLFTPVSKSCVFLILKTEKEDKVNEGFNQKSQKYKKQELNELGYLGKYWFFQVVAASFLNQSSVLSYDWRTFIPWG